jgi:hypothetical protein
MQAINNTGILNICGSCNCTGFAAGVSYAYDAGAKTITVTEGSTFPAADALAIVHVYVTDKHGNSKYGKIEAAGGNVVINVAAMNANGGFNIIATVVSNDKCIGDLAVYDVAAATVAAGTAGTFTD